MFWRRHRRARRRVELETLIDATVNRHFRWFGDMIMTEFGDVKAKLDGVFADLAAKIERLQESIDNPSTETRLSAEDQALWDSIKASVNAARGTVGDENADGTPAPVPTPEPEPEPVPAPEPTDVPAPPAF